MNMEVSNNVNGTNEQETVVILDAGAQYGKVRSMDTSPVFSPAVVYVFIFIWIIKLAYSTLLC